MRPPSRPPSPPPAEEEEEEEEEIPDKDDVLEEADRGVSEKQMDVLSNVPEADPGFEESWAGSTAQTAIRDTHQSPTGEEPGILRVQVMALSPSYSHSASSRSPSSPPSRPSHTLTLALTLDPVGRR